MNTDRLEDFSPACPTIDAIKTARKFGSVKDPGDGKAPTDADGWPTGDFGVVVAADVPGIEGVYKLSCEGKASVAGTWGQQTVVQHLKFDGQCTTADVHFRGGVLALAFTGTTGGVRNLKLLRPGYQSADAVFTDVYLKSKEPFGGVRLMNWTRTNDSPVKTWADRSKITDARWSRLQGGPWEPWLDYAAKQHADLWLNIPHQADDDYVHQLALLCKQRLGDAPVHLYLENTNEYWNWQFGQAKWTDAQAKETAAEGKLNEPATGEGDLRHRYHARRTVEIGRMFKEVFGNGDPRIRPILTGQVANPGATEDAVFWIEKHFGPAKDHIYAVGCAPYFGNWGDVTTRVDMTPEQVAEHLVKAANALSTDQSKTNTATRRFHDLAKRKGIRSVAYEGGADLGSAPGKLSKSDLTRFIAARAAAQALPDAGNAVSIYFDWWFKSGGDEFFYYKDFSPYNKSGYFGLSNDPTQIDTPKYRAAFKAASKARAEEEDRG